MFKYKQGKKIVIILFIMLMTITLSSILAVSFNKQEDAYAANSYTLKLSYTDYNGDRKTVDLTCGWSIQGSSQNTVTGWNITASHFNSLRNSSSVSLGIVSVSPYIAYGSIRFNNTSDWENYSLTFDNATITKINGVDSISDSNIRANPNNFGISLTTQTENSSKFYARISYTGGNFLIAGWRDGTYSSTPFSTTYLSRFLNSNTINERYDNYSYISFEYITGDISTFRSVYSGCSFSSVSVSSFNTQISNAQNITFYANKTYNYEINNQSDLISFRNFVNSDKDTSAYASFSYNVNLRADITLSSEWTPIGWGNNKEFTGYFYGNGFTISNVWISAAASEYTSINRNGSNDFSAGFFGTVRNATIQDVHLDNVDIVIGEDINVQTQNSTNSIGALVGCALGTTSISRCMVTNSSVTGYESSNWVGSDRGQAAGGLVGTIGTLTDTNGGSNYNPYRNLVSISNCAVQCNVSVIQSYLSSGGGLDGIYGGGIVGAVYINTHTADSSNLTISITNSYWKGTANIINKNNQVYPAFGGVLGPIFGTGSLLDNYSITLRGNFAYINSDSEVSYSNPYDNRTQAYENTTFQPICGGVYYSSDIYLLSNSTISHYGTVNISNNYFSYTSDGETDGNGLSNRMRYYIRTNGNTNKDFVESAAEVASTSNQTFTTTSASVPRVYKNMSWSISTDANATTTWYLPRSSNIYGGFPILRQFADFVQVQVHAGQGGSVNNTSLFKVPKGAPISTSGQQITIYDTTITATASAGYQFVNFSNFTSPVNSDQTNITANFELIEYQIYFVDFYDGSIDVTEIYSNGILISGSSLTVYYNTTINVDSGNLNIADTHNGTTSPDIYLVTLSILNSNKYEFVGWEYSTTRNGSYSEFTELSVSRDIYVRPILNIRAFEASFVDINMDYFETYTCDVDAATVLGVLLVYGSPISISDNVMTIVSEGTTYTITA